MPLTIERALSHFTAILSVFTGLGYAELLLSVLVGAVIRGGMVGDDDHCDPRGGGVRRPATGRVIGGDVYGRNPMGGAMGGMGGGRVIGGGRARP